MQKTLFEVYKDEMYNAKTQLHFCDCALDKEYWSGYIDALMALRGPMSHLHELENDLDHVENLLFNLKNRKVSSK